jgi:small acid-soluble spore protein (thioredoxin-like protein)
MNPHPDDRRDNVDRIQHHIDTTIQNMELADELIEKTSDPKAKEDLKDKNERRRHALDGMRHEIKDEAEHQKKSKANEFWSKEKQ